MANTVAQEGMAGANGALTVRTALRLAWVTWVVLLLIPFFLFLAVVWTLGISESGSLQAAHSNWFLGASAYLLVVVPLAFFWRGRVFKPYWTGQVIAPLRYLYGMLAMWAALEFGGIFGLLGCLVDHSLLPNLLPALIAFMFYVTLWPSGRAMVKHVGQYEDAAKYEEPR